jgi:DNA modification methylase
VSSDAGNHGAALIVQGDARRLPLPDSSVDLIVTSPPFWNLRDYGVAGQLGNESSRQAFLEQLWEATAECMRVMKPTASLFVELGDSYANRATPERVGSSDGLLGRGDRPGRLPRGDTPEKSLNLTPQRYVIGCVDNLGLTLRAEIIWSRPNGLPESVKDRVRLSHSRWWHLVKQPRYYSATDEVREPSQPPKQATASASPRRIGVPGVREYLPAEPTRREYNPLGKLPGSVWTIPSEPLRLPDHLGVQHYAAFPSEWPRRLILGWSPPGICLECGQGRVPVVERHPFPKEERVKPHRGDYGPPEASIGAKDGFRGGNWRGQELNAWKAANPDTILGYACSCTPFTDHPERRRPSVTRQASGDLRVNQDTYEQATGARGHATGNGWPERLPVREYHLDGWQPPPTRPSVILDPFSGVGTTVGVAKRLGRIGIGVDLSGPYCRAARWRVNDPDQFGKAEGRTNLERQGQLL